MIRIFKDSDIKLVTKGAYKSFYEPLGYQVVIEGASTEKVVEPEIKNDDNKEIVSTGTKVSSKRNTRGR